MACAEASNFTLAEKVFLRVLLWGSVAIGAYSIFDASLIWGAAYICYIVAGSYVMFYLFCTHCPYPFEYTDCLLYPFILIKKPFAYRPVPMRTAERLAFRVVLAGIVLFPQYWLVKNTALLIAFWLMSLLLLVSFIFRICRKCKNRNCSSSGVHCAGTNITNRFTG